MPVRRFAYNMHHTWITESEMGDLVPIFCQEVVPGDTWRGVSSCLVRSAALEVPAFITLNLVTHFFFVPHRIVWSGWEDFITGVDPATPIPTITVGQGAPGQLLLALGLGGPNSAGGGSTYTAQSLPIRAYNEIYNEFFRDQATGTLAGSESTFLQKVNFPASDYYGGLRDRIQQGPEEQVDASGGTVAVTDIRDAFHRQKFKERRSQFGERYTDYLAAMGLNVPDSRLDRPEHDARGSGVKIGRAHV